MGWIDKISGKLGRLEESFKLIDAYYQELIDEYIGRSVSSPAQNNILDILIRMMRDKSSPFEIKFEHIKALLMVII